MSQTQQQVVSAREDLTPDQIEEFKTAFEMFDEDGGGDISTAELGRVLNLLGWNPTRNELNEIINTVDASQSGAINFEGFLQLMVTWMKDDKTKNTEDELKEAFRVFDKDGSGYIEWEELKYVMQGTGEPLTDEEVTAMMKEADKDGDGRIDYEEFVAMMTGESQMI